MEAVQSAVVLWLLIVFIARLDFLGCNNVAYLTAPQDITMFH